MVVRGLGRISVLMITMLCLPGTALAGPPGQWTEFTSHEVNNFAYHGYERTADGVLHVAWSNPRDDGELTQGLWHTAFAPDGTLVRTNQIVAGNAGEGDLVLDPGGGLRAFFGALLDQDNQNLSTATASQAGDNWSLKNGDIASGGNAYAAPIAAAVAKDGTFFQAWAGYTHRGLSASTANQDYQGSSGCCAYDARLAIDQQTGQMYRAWFTLDDNSGLHVQEVNLSNGAPTGSKMDVPGVAEDGDSAMMSGRPQITGIPGQAGVYVAYHGGYPFSGDVVVWRVGDAEPTILASTESVDYEVAMAAAPDGRLWVLWGTSGGEHESNVILYRVSDTTRTSWSPVASIQRPPDGGDFHTLHNLAADAQSDRVDVFAHIKVGQTADSFESTWHTQIMSPIAGGDGDDDLQGTPADEVFFGGGGDDTIDGGGGNDVIVGGDGNDVMSGGPGKDKINGGAGEDRIVGDENKSPSANARGWEYSASQTAEPTADRLAGGGGNDTILGMAGNDKLKGDAGNDLLKGGPGANDFNGGAGVDTCILSDKRDDTKSCEREKRNFKRNFQPAKLPS